MISPSPTANQMQPRVLIRNVQQLHCLRTDADKSAGMVDGTASRFRMRGEVGGLQGSRYPEEVFLMFMKIEKDGVPWNLCCRWLP
jgi:hypothetical protein